jgi:lysophospholipid acyltransferase (LPLAT)-like uncharacterized protein
MKGTNRWWRYFQGNALFVYFRLITRTARWNMEGRENIAAARASGRPLLWTFWHGQAMPFVQYADRFEDNKSFIAILVGDDRWDVLSTLSARLQADRSYAVDMGGNPVAAGRAVLNAIKAMRLGKQLVLAPDGPDGPPYVAKEGVGYLARKAAAAVLPVGAWTRQAFQMRRWDRYLVPLPFARVHLSFGRPILADPKMDGNSLLATISEALHVARSRAQVMAGIKPWR